MSTKEKERVLRARKIVTYLKKTYPNPETELVHTTPFQLVAAVMLSAQCTDKHVNNVTKTLWKKYKTPKDFASSKTFEKDISSIPLALPGIGYKTAHVILGELHDIWEGIPTDTHVRRFALRFDLTNNTELTKISKDLETLIPKKDWKFVNNGFVLYGRYVCPARPHECMDHPLTKLWPNAATRWPKAK
jgi:endonuclease-3